MGNTGSCSLNGNRVLVAFWLSPEPTSCRQDELRKSPTVELRPAIQLSLPRHTQAHIWLLRITMRTTPRSGSKEATLIWSGSISPTHKAVWVSIPMGRTRTFFTTGFTILIMVLVPTPAAAEWAAAALSERSEPALTILGQKTLFGTLGRVGTIIPTASLLSG